MSAQSSPERLIRTMASAVASLREVLEADRIDEFGRVIDAAQQALDDIQQFPGGIDGLRDAIDRGPEEQKVQLRELIIKASEDHQVNGELIKIATQKNAALQALVAQESDSATYSDRGQVPSVLGSLLSRKA